jgi:hypothetical protein
VTGSPAFAFVAAAIFCCALPACSGSPARVASVSAASAAAASDLLPSDLDVVVRVDWPRVISNPLFSRARDAVSGAGLARIARIGRVLDDARTVLIGMRILSDGVQGDGVVVIEGENTTLDPDDLLAPGSVATFHRLPAPRGMSVFERQGAFERGDAAFVVILAHRGILIATPAESDALRRTARSGADTDRLDPPARGLLSFAGRARPGWNALLGSKGRFLRKILDGLTGFSGSVDSPAGAALAVEADLVYADIESAAKADEAMRAVGVALEPLGPWLGAVARSLNVSRHDEMVTLRGAIPSSLAKAAP